MMKLKLYLSIKHKIRTATPIFYINKVVKKIGLFTCIFLFFYNEPELGVGIDPGMALTPLPSSI